MPEALVESSNEENTESGEEVSECDFDLAFEFGLPSVTYASVVIDQGGVAYLYYGRVESYDLGTSADGGLRRFVLTDTRRRELHDDRGRDEEHAVGGGEHMYPIIGHRFVIEYSQVRTMNLQYVWLLPVTAKNTDDSPTN